MAVSQPRVAWDPRDNVSVRNDEATTLVKGTIVKRGTVQDGVLLPDAVTDECLGVIQNDTLTAEWGVAQAGGAAAVLAGAAVAVGDKIMPTTAGKGIPWTAAAGANAALIGTANSAAAADELFECELAGPANMKQGA